MIFIVIARSFVIRGGKNSNEKATYVQTRRQKKNSKKNNDFCHIKK